MMARCRFHKFTKYALDHLFNICIGRKLTKFKMPKLILSEFKLTYLCTSDTLKALGGVDFTRCALLSIIQYSESL